MNAQDARKLAKRKRRIERRLAPRNFKATEVPVFRVSMAAEKRVNPAS